jgi:cyclopropane fatty-acyl-phospholipid synthase-like methyltransferase
MMIPTLNYGAAPEPVVSSSILGSAGGLALVSNPTEVKLDLGCGESPLDGFEGVDIRSSAAKHKVNLFKFPFPWADGSVDELRSTHFIEHIPAREVERQDLVMPLATDPALERFLGQDMLLAFFDECHRILKPKGRMFVVVPAARSDGAFQDPTHRRFINQYTFSYLSAENRKAMKLEHYIARCDFEFNAQPVGPAEFSVLCEEAQRRRFHHEWNTILEWHVSLTKKGGEQPT